MTYYWKSRGKGERWKVEEHDTFDDLLESMESRMGLKWDIKIMSINQCTSEDIYEEGQQLRGLGGDIHLVIANLHLLCDKLARTFDATEACVVDSDDGYTGHRNEIEALHYAACHCWPDSEHEIVKVVSDVVSGAPSPVTLDESERVRRPSDRQP